MHTAMGIITAVIGQRSQGRGGQGKASGTSGFRGYFRELACHRDSKALDWSLMNLLGHDCTNVEGCSAVCLAAGDVSRQLLDGDGFARVQQVVHLAQGVLAIVVHSILRLRLAYVVLIVLIILIRH